MTVSKSEPNSQLPAPVLLLPTFDPRKDDDRSRSEFVVVRLSPTALAELDTLRQELHRISEELPGTSAIIRRDSTAIIVAPARLQVEPQEWFDREVKSLTPVLLMESAILTMIGHKVPVHLHVEADCISWDSHMGSPGGSRLTSFRIPWDYLLRPLFLGVPRANIAEQFRILCENNPWAATTLLIEGVKPDWGDGYRLQQFLQPADLELILLHRDADIRQRAIFTVGEFKRRHLGQ